MTKTNDSTYPKYDITKRVQGYLETAMPHSVLLAAYRTGRQEAIVTHVKEHYNADAGDCIGIETVVRDAIQNLVLSETFQEADSDALPLPPTPWRVCRFPHAGSDVPWSVKDADGVVIADFHTKDLATLFAASPALTTAAHRTTDRLADLPRYLRANNAHALAEVVQLCITELMGATEGKVAQ
ncbi:MAG TPA: hypothetical protein VJS64_09455 [Pyrinomonadaceae bacterium]|nr:hypothetical protein [Pyrinomonadaceae bacterium]